MSPAPSMRLGCSRSEMIQPMFDVLERGRVSTDVGEKLEGLLAPEKIQDVVLILKK